VGTTGKTGWMSPKNMWTSTITDQLKMAQNYKSKTIAIALKDRGAILVVIRQMRPIGMIRLMGIGLPPLFT